MKWPWVARSTMDAQVEFFRENIMQQRAEYAEFRKYYHELKLHGASVSEPAVAREIPPVDPVSAAINIAAGHDRQLRIVMQAEAQRMRDADYSDMDIVEMIQTGISSPEGIPA